jgi:hypothetical protein
MGVPPADRELTVTGIDICRLNNGKIVELWHEESTVALLTQLGVLPAPAGA